MSNVEKIMFDAKYSLKYMNGLYVLSGFNHTKSVRIGDRDIYDFLNDTDFVYFDEEDWEEFVEKYNAED